MKDRTRSGFARATAFGVAMAVPLVMLAACFCSPALAEIPLGEERVMCPPGLLMDGVWRDHFAYSGRPVLLKAVLRNYEPSRSYTYEWAFGDGSTSGQIPADNKEMLQAFHSYADTTPGRHYTATITVRSGATVVGQRDYSITYHAPHTPDVKYAVAIEDGMWYLSREMDRVTLFGIQRGSFGKGVDNAIGLLAFVYRGHRPVSSGGSPDDPYSENIERLLNHIFAESFKQPMGSPYDGNGNGYGLYNAGEGVVSLGTASKQPQTTGLMLAALSLPGMETFVAQTGIPEVKNKTAQQLRQDYADYLFWSQYRIGLAKGGWDTTPGNPSSMGQTGWVARGLATAAQQGISLSGPSDWKQLLNSFLTYDQNINGSFGNYNKTDNPGFRFTAAALTPLWLVGEPLIDPNVISPGSRLDKAREWLGTNWNANTGLNKHFGDLQSMNFLAYGSQLYGLDFYGAHDWREDYDAWVVANQNLDQGSFIYGSWDDLSVDGQPYNPILSSNASTSWILLFRDDLEPPCIPPVACLETSNGQFTCNGYELTLDASCSIDPNQSPSIGVDAYEFTLCDGTSYVETATSAPDGGFDGVFRGVVCSGQTPEVCQIAVRVRNTCGLWSDDQAVQINCPSANPPSCNLQARQHGDCGILLDASGSADPQGLPIVRYSFTTSDGQQYQETPALAPDGQFDGKWAPGCSLGAKTACVVVENCLGKVSTQCCVAYECYKAPAACASVATQLDCSGVTATVDARCSSDPNNPAKPIVAYEFSFCDGHTYTESTASAGDGTFDGMYAHRVCDGKAASSCWVDVRAQNSCGAWSAPVRKSINCQAAQPPVCSLAIPHVGVGTVLFDASGSTDPQGLPIVKFTFSYPGGTYVETSANAPDGSFDGVYIASCPGTGQKSVTVTVENCLGKISSGCTRTYECCVQPVACGQVTALTYECDGVYASVDAGCSYDPNSPPRQIDSYELKFCNGATYVESLASAPDGAFDGRYTGKVCSGTVQSACWVDIRVHNSGMCDSWSQPLRLNFQCQPAAKPVGDLKAIPQANETVTLDASGSIDPNALDIVRYTFTSPLFATYTETTTNAPDGAFDGKYSVPCRTTPYSACVVVENCLGVISDQNCVNVNPCGCKAPVACGTVAATSLTCDGGYVTVDASCSSDANIPALPITAYEFTFCNGLKYTEQAGNAPDGAFDGRYTGLVCDGRAASSCWVDVRVRNGSPCETWSNAFRVTFTCPVAQPPNMPSASFECLPPGVQDGPARVRVQTVATDPQGLPITRYRFTFCDGTVYTETSTNAPDGAFDGAFIKSCSGETDNCVDIEVENCLGKVSPVYRLTYPCCGCALPECDIALSATSMVSGGEICVDASGSTDTNDPPRSLVEYRFTLSCADVVYVETSANAPDGSFDGKHCFRAPETCIEPGSCTVSVAVKNACGATSECSESFLVTACNHRPTADPGGPYVVCVGNELELDGCGSSDPDAGDSIAEWKWTVTPDGHHSPVILTGCNPRIAFDGPGTYTICLEVRDQQRDCCKPAALWSPKVCTTVEVKTGGQQMTVTPESEVNAPGQPHILEICVRDVCLNQGVQGIPVSIAVTGANQLSAQTVTGPDGCVTWTYNSFVEGQDTITVTAPGLRETVSKTWRRNPPKKLWQATAGFSNPPLLGCMGYAGFTPTDAVEAVPGVLQIVPGENWANFMQSPDGQLEFVSLVKYSAGVPECPDLFFAHSITQYNENVRTVWPLLYEAPGTIWTLSVRYSTPTPVQLPGESGPSSVHTSVFSYEVDVDVDHMIHLLKLLHTLPFGASQVPLIADELLYQELLGHLLYAKDGFDNDRLFDVVAGLANFELALDGACIFIAPPRPSPTGPTVGVVQTIENPVCCKLTIDAEYLLRKLANP